MFLFVILEIIDDKKVNEDIEDIMAINEQIPNAIDVQKLTNSENKEQLIEQLVENGENKEQLVENDLLEAKSKGIRK